jgi:hypothetical protein
MNADRPDEQDGKSINPKNQRSSASRFEFQVFVFVRGFRGPKKAV